MPILLATSRLKMEPNEGIQPSQRSYRLRVLALDESGKNRARPLTGIRADGPYSGATPMPRQARDPSLLKNYRPALILAWVEKYNLK
jgi:hypothetical protein